MRSGGLLLTWWSTRLLEALSLPLPIPLAFDLHIDGRVLAFTLFATMLAGVLAGLAPAVHASKPSLVADLRGETQLAHAGALPFTLRDLLVMGQIAMTALLLIVAALMTRSLIVTQRTNLGFPVNRLAVLSTDTGMLKYSDEKSRQFYDQAIEKVEAIAGVESAALVTRVPMQVNASRWEVWIPGHHTPGEHGDVVEQTSVSPEYFNTMGVRIVEGRAFTDDDRPDTPRVAIVNEAFARRYWPGQSAIGKTLRSRASDGPLFEIVGVSADHKVVSVSEPPTPFLQVARSQRPGSYVAIVARTSGDAGTLLREMRRQLLSLDSNLVFVENQTMAAEVDATLFPARASAWLVTGVGVVAMLLAAVGLYGVIAYSVARRTREIGIRIALGARPGTVVGLVMRQGLAVAGAGMLIGCVFAILAAMFAVRTLPGGLNGITAGDPMAWLSAILVLLAVSTLANLIPAWRASRVEPTVALRIE